MVSNRSYESILTYVEACGRDLSRDEQRSPISFVGSILIIKKGLEISQELTTKNKKKSQELLHECSE